MNTLKVSQVNTYIKALIDASEPLRSIYVEGEISNFKHHQPSGHMYFTLKDDKSQLKAVIFASSAYRLRFRPENGMSVICRGRVGNTLKRSFAVFLRMLRELFGNTVTDPGGNIGTGTR